MALEVTREFDIKVLHIEYDLDCRDELFTFLDERYGPGCWCFKRAGPKHEGDGYYSDLHGLAIIHVGRPVDL